MAADRGTSPWVYIGCGCAGCLGLCVLMVAAAAFFGVSVFQGFVEDMEDPAARSERAREILGTEELPDDYHARLFVRVPWVLDVVILTDGPQDEAAGDLDEFAPLDAEHLGVHAFIYLAARRGVVDGDIESIFEGRRRGGRSRVDLDAHFESRRELSRGSFEIAGGEASYVAHQGEIEIEDHQRIEGVYSLMRIDCPDDRKDRLAVWFERTAEGAPGGEDEAPAIAGAAAVGSPADEEALRDFMGHFDLCAR